MVTLTEQEIDFMKEQIAEEKLPQRCDPQTPRGRGA
jgi:hypothetical protein